jgi:hypothetical protein
LWQEERDTSGCAVGWSRNSEVIPMDNIFDAGIGASIQERTLEQIVVELERMESESDTLTGKRY